MRCSTAFIGAVYAHSHFVHWLLPILMRTLTMWILKPNGILHYGFGSSTSPPPAHVYVTQVWTLLPGSTHLEGKEATHHQVWGGGYSGVHTLWQKEGEREGRGTLCKMPCFLFRQRPSIHPDIPHPAIFFPFLFGGGGGEITQKYISNKE